MDSAFWRRWGATIGAVMISIWFSCGSVLGTSLVLCGTAYAQTALTVDTQRAHQMMFGFGASTISLAYTEAPAVRVLPGFLSHIRSDCEVPAIESMTRASAGRPTWAPHSSIGNQERQ